MLVSRNKSQFYGTEPAAFYKEKLRNRMEPGGNTMQVIVRRAARFRTHFGYGSYSEYTLVEEDRQFSKSLTDLTRIERETESVTRKAGMRNLNTKESSNTQFPRTETKITREAGMRVTHFLMLHAWRCRILDAEKSRTIINALHNQVESLNMQVYALKQLLENEKTRRKLAVKKMYTEKAENEQERNLILKESETLKCKVKELLQIKVEYENQKNNFKAAVLEIEQWKMHYEKEKENSETLEDLYVILEQKAREKDEMISEQRQSLGELNQSKTAVEEELHNKLSLLNDSIEQLNSVQKKLKLSEELRKQQERFLMEKNEEINQLRAQIALMEEKLQEQDERNGELGKLISDKTKELVLLQDKLGELTKNQRFWGNRVIQMASICTRIPIACFYTVATLLLPQPSYRPI